MVTMAAAIGTIKRRIIKKFSPAGADGVRRLPNRSATSVLAILRFPPALNNPPNRARARRADAAVRQYLPPEGLLSVNNGAKSDF